MPDIRRKKTDNTFQPPEMRHIDVPGMRGTLPFSPGKVIPTPAEKEFLKKHGWKEGDPLPDLTKIVRAEVGVTASLKDMESHVKSSPLKTYPDDTPNFVPPPTIAIEDLDEGKRKAIMASIEQMRNQAAAAANKKPEEQFMPTDPSVASAMNVAQQVAARAQPVQLEDDLRPEYDPSKLKRAPARAERQKAKPKETVMSPPATTSTPTPTAIGTTDDTQYDTGGEATRTHCQHCGWELAKAYDIVVTDQDRDVYVASVLGDKRFVKQYKLFGGKILVTLRSMTTAEADLVRHQLFLDGKAQRVTTPAEVYYRVREYWLALCLQSITSDGVNHDLAEFHQYDVDKDEDNTGLPDVLEYVYSNVIKQDGLRKMLLPLIDNFYSLQTKVEAESYKADF